MLIIHGDDTAKSRNFLNRQISLSKKQGTDIVRLEADGLEPVALEQNLGSFSLFGHGKAIVIFNFFKLINCKNKDKLKQILIKNQDKNINLYEDRQVNNNSLKVFGKAQVRLFKANPIIFKFTESIKPGNKKQTLIYLKQLEEAQVSPSAIFAMLVRQVRLLLTAKDTPNELKLASWQKQRLISQARNFSLEQIIRLHTQLYQIDKNIKTAKTALELKDLLFNFLIQF